jgi:hypothetical protein
MAEKPECFVIAPIGAAGSDIRKRSDQILKYVIRPVVEQCGYTAVRADEIGQPGMITSQVLTHIVNDAMVVADLTGDNANVFYELAVRHAIRKPFVQIIQKGDRIPFDVAGVRTIEVDHKNLDSVEEAKIEMTKQMQFTAEHPDRIESPISVAVDLESLKKSGDPEKRQLGEILSGLGEIKQLIQAQNDRQLRSIAERAHRDLISRNLESDVADYIKPSLATIRATIHSLAGCGKTR